MSVKRFGTSIVIAAVVGFSGAIGAWAAEKEAGAKLTTKEVMAQAFKGKGDTLYKKVEAGKGTKEENAHLLELVKAMAANTPKKGDKASWDEKTGALVKAAQLVAEADPKGPAELKAAGNCKSCHMVHKGS